MSPKETYHTGNWRRFKISSETITERIFICEIQQEKNVRLISAYIPIKCLPEGTKVLCSLIAPIIKEGNCSDSCKFFARHFINGSSHIKGIDFDQSYTPVAHTDSFRINIDIAAMHRLTARVLDVSNSFQNTHVPSHERLYSSPPP